MRVMATLLLAVLLAPAAMANEGEGPCRADVEKFCKDVEPGGGRIMKCLKEHQDELSGECKERGAKLKERWQEKKGEWEEACKADQDKLCGDVKPGGGRIMKCMKEHESDLSDGCREKMEAAGKRWKQGREAMEACRADKEKLCADVKPGDGRVMECMQAHEKELSDACRGMMRHKRDEMKSKGGDDDSDAAPAEKESPDEKSEKGDDSGSENED